MSVDTARCRAFCLSPLSLRRSLRSGFVPRLSPQEQTRRARRSSALKSWQRQTPGSRYSRARKGTLKREILP